MVICILTAACGMGAADSETKTTSGRASAVVRTSVGTVEVAEAFQVDLAVTVSAGSSVVWPVIGDRLGEFDVTDVRDFSDLPADSNPQQRIWKRRLTLETISTGQLTVPSMELKIVTDEQTETLATAECPILVSSVLPDNADPQQFRDLRPPVDVSLPQTPSGSGTRSFIAVVAVAIGILLVLWWRSRSKFVSPAARAILKLQELRSQVSGTSTPISGNLVQVADVCRELSRILTEYQALTSLQSAAGSEHAQELPDIQNERLRQLVQRADEVRFAAVPMSLEQTGAMIDQALQLVNEPKSSPRSSQVTEAEA
ncbi:MAG: hypothetical protein R3C49_15335 [Planctomycetaceae bacterium]